MHTGNSGNGIKLVELSLIYVHPIFSLVIERNIKGAGLENSKLYSVYFINFLSRAILPHLAHPVTLRSALCFDVVFRCLSFLNFFAEFMAASVSALVCERLVEQERPQFFSLDLSYHIQRFFCKVLLIKLEPEKW